MSQRNSCDKLTVTTYLFYHELLSIHDTSRGVFSFNYLRLEWCSDIVNKAILIKHLKDGRYWHITLMIHLILLWMNISIILIKSLTPAVQKEKKKEKLSLLRFDSYPLVFIFLINRRCGWWLLTVLSYWTVTVSHRSLIGSQGWCIKIMQHSAQPGRCTGPSYVCQWTSKWFKVGLGESAVARWNQNRALCEYDPKSAIPTV